MMKRRIIHIDEDKCNGCGACAAACHEGAIDMIDGKAKLVREHYCDGLGDCLPACPTEAITFEEREAPAYDEAAVLAAKQKKLQEQHAAHGGCPGARMREMNQSKAVQEASKTGDMPSQLRQWPCQLKLVPVNAPYFDSAQLLIAADCTAYAYANMHQDYMKGKITLIGCPKLDDVNYSEKLTEIIKNNDVKDITIVRMEVPCCGGLEYAVKAALQSSNKTIPCSTVIVSIEGNIL